MSHTDFTEIFTVFKEKFPPAPSAAESTLRLTTNEIEKMVVDFYPQIEFPQGGLFPVLREMGYHYGPVEENEHVIMYWFVSVKE